MALLPRWKYVEQIRNLDTPNYCIERKISSRAGFEENASSAQITYIILSDDENLNLRKFTDDLLGYAKWNIQQSKLIRTLPDQHPVFRRMFCFKVDCDRWDDCVVNRTTHTYPAAKPKYWAVTAYYKVPDYDILPDTAIDYEYQRFTRMDEKDEVQFLTLPSSFTFVASGRVLAAPPGKLVCTSALTMELVRIPHVISHPTPWLNPFRKRVLQNIGKVNASEFLGNAPGTVLFLGCEPQKVTPDTSGRDLIKFYFNVKFKFAIKDDGDTTYGERAGWNYILDTSGWDLVTTDGFYDPPGGSTTTRIYFSNGNFNSLFLADDGGV
jgi:hypothetical protein